MLGRTFKNSLKRDSFWNGIKSNIESGLLRPIPTGRKMPALQRGTVGTSNSTVRKFDKSIAALREVRQTDVRWGVSPLTSSKKRARPEDIAFSHNALRTYLDTIRNGKLHHHRRAKRIYESHFKAALRPRTAGKVHMKRPMLVHKNPVVHKLSAAMLKETIRRRASEINKKGLKDKNLQPQIHCQRALSLREQPILPCKRMINR